MIFNENIIELARKNTFFRQVLFTTERTQLVLMAIDPGVDLGDEIHKADQILVFVEGEGQAILEGKTSLVTVNSLVVVPEGTKHRFKNIGSGQLKLFTFYAPPQHKEGTVDKTQKDAEREKH